MNGKNILIVYLKELRDSLRDRRTLISMIVIPTLVMPVLVLGIGLVSYRVVAKAREAVPSVMVIGGDDSPHVHAALAGLKTIQTTPATGDWRQRISDRQVRAAVEFSPGFDRALERGEPAAVTIYHYTGEMRSSFAVDTVRRFFAEYRDRNVAGRLAAHGLPATLIKPFQIESKNVAPPEKVGGNVVGGLIPYFFLLLSFTGAMYPAMDLTAGEKERGTLETILCSPVARADLVLGKFLMVLTASLATVIFSLGSMGLTFLVGGWLMGGSAEATGTAALTRLPSLDLLGTLAVVAMVIPMAVLFSAVLLAVSLFAKSFKEAQTYVSPLIIVILLPAIIGLLPGVELNAQLALVPILNVSLVSKELVSGVWHWGYLALIFGSTSIYAALALGLTVKMFNREKVLFRA